MARPVASLLAACLLATTVAGCNDMASSTKASADIPAKTVALMSEKGMGKSDPILVRLYKKESEVEVWKRVNGHYALLKTYPICRWSGQLGPKTKEGDRQAPEGFYTVTPGLMNPNSAYYLSFDTGYPNAYDRAYGRTGSQLMVHGNCSSRGCYAMTDEGIAEVYAIAREAFAGGQRGFQLQAYPFRMTAENLAKYRNDPNMPFWKNLKEGSDHFEVTKREPKVAVCERRYAFNTVGDGCKEDPTLAPILAQKEGEDRAKVAELVAGGMAAVRTVYADGSQHESFRPGAAPFDGGSALAILDSRPRRNLGDVSRPEALTEGPREIAMADPVKPAGKASLASLTVARAKAAAGPERAGTKVASADPDEPVALSSGVKPAGKTSKASDKKAPPSPKSTDQTTPARPKLKTSQIPPEGRHVVAGAE